MRLKFQNGGRGTEVVRQTLWFEHPLLRAVYLGDRINQKICRASCSHGCANISHSQKRSPPSCLLAFFSSFFFFSLQTFCFRSGSLILNFTSTVVYINNSALLLGLGLTYGCLSRVGWFQDRTRRTRARRLVCGFWDD